jgi:hypothetical protein
MLFSLSAVGGEAASSFFLFWSSLICSDSDIILSLPMILSSNERITRI